MAGKKQATAALDRPQSPDGGLSVEEIIAQFQLQTEQMISQHQRDSERKLAVLQQKCGQLEDAVNEGRAQMTELRATVDGACHQMRRGVHEVNEALRVAVSESQKAAHAARVYEKLKEAQPNFTKMINRVQTELGRVKDRVVVLGEQINRAQGMLDASGATLREVKIETESHGRMLSHPGLVQVVAD